MTTIPNPEVLVNSKLVSRQSLRLTNTFPNIRWNLTRVHVESQLICPGNPLQNRGVGDYGRGDNKLAGKYLGETGFEPVTSCL